jgi:hypothetical protein
MKERYLLPLRILLTILILTMMLPGWGLLSASHLYQEGSIEAENRPISAMESVADIQGSPAR